MLRYSVVPKVRIIFHFFCRKKPVTLYLIRIVNKSKFRTKIQTFSENLVKEPRNNINHKLRYGTKIVREKFPNYGALYILLYLFGNGGFRRISCLFEKKLALKHVRELRYLHFLPFVQCTKGGKLHFCSNLNEISHARFWSSPGQKPPAPWASIPY